jgi:hypothetical protein
MARAGASLLKEGVVAGIIGAAVVALWFLVFDIARGKPLLTPSLLGAAVFQGGSAPTGLQVQLGLVIGYTILHGLVFIAFGIIAASVISATEREPALVIALVILFACFETFFLGVVGVLGRAVTDALSWWAILAANFLAAVAMLWYFLLRHRSLLGSLVGSWAGVLREGAVAGLIGAAVVAVWFLAVDALQGEPLRTPNLLATALLKASPGAPAVIVYTVLHGAAFVVFGIVATVLIAGAEREPMFVFALVIVFTAFEVFFFAVVVIAARWVLAELWPWEIFVGNLLAAAAMLAYFYKGHRTLARRVTVAWTEED